MSNFEDELRFRLQTIEQQNLLRRLRCVNSPQGTSLWLDGREVLNFSSNDYLGLANHPAVKEASAQATADYGAGTGASRLICGSLKPHHTLEESLASFKQTEAAITFSSGYATALSTIAALVGKDDYVVLDKLVHASIVDGAKLSGATLRIFHHNDMNSLETILAWCRKQSSSHPRNILVVTESVFSMDGDFAPLRSLVELKEKYGAWLMVDEAHATGLFGSNRCGRAQEEGVSGEIEIQMGTLGKAIGSAGGFIAGTRTLIDYLVNRARAFIFSTAPPPGMAAAAEQGLEVILSREGGERLNRLRANHSQFTKAGMTTGDLPFSPIVPLIVGSEQSALDLAGDLLARGIYVPAIRYPTVGKGKARLRFTFSADHSSDEIKTLLAGLATFSLPKEKPGISPASH